MYEVEFSYPMGSWQRGSVWIGHCWTFEDAVEDFNRRIKQITIDSGKIDTVVMSKMGTIHIGKSRYQAEQALSYLKKIIQLIIIIIFQVLVLGAIHIVYLCQKKLGYTI